MNRLQKRTGTIYNSAQDEQFLVRKRTAGGISMDWKSFSEHFDTMTCVISVEKKPDGKCGTVRIVTGNRKYLDSLELAAGHGSAGSPGRSRRPHVSGQG